MAILMTKSDAEITDNVIAELIWDPAVIVAELDVVSSNGMVNLYGTAAYFGVKYAAEEAAYRVGGVRGVTNDIVVDPRALGVRVDADIQTDVRGAFLLDTGVPDDRLGVSVHEGFVILTGNLDHNYQRTAAEEDARRIAGVKGVTNHISVLSPGVIADDVEARIAQAFQRHAELFDDNVSAVVAGSTVTLGGTVRTWSEYGEAEAATWRAPGVRDVENNIIVTH